MTATDVGGRTDWNGPSRRGSAKLTDPQVRLIKRRLWADERQVDLAKEYGVTRACINDLARGKTWKWCN